MGDFVRGWGFLLGWVVLITVGVGILAVGALIGLWEWDW